MISSRIDFVENTCALPGFGCLSYRDNSVAVFIVTMVITNRVNLF